MTSDLGVKWHLWKGKRGSRTGEMDKLSYKGVSVEPSVNPTESSEVGGTLQSCLELGVRGHLYCSQQSLNACRLWKGQNLDSCRGQFLKCLSAECSLLTGLPGPRRIHSSLTKVDLAGQPSLCYSCRISKFWDLFFINVLISDLIFKNHVYS